MNNHIEMVPLRTILNKSEETVPILPDHSYRRITVRLWGKGVTERDHVSGADIGGDRMFVAHAGQFILSRIDARNGAIGLIPPQLDGAVATNDFPLFNLDTSVVEPGFLAWMSRTARFADICRAASEGTTNRIRLKEDRFLAFEVPLPPIREQRRIVAHIEELAARIEEARGLRAQVMSVADAYWNSELRQSFRTGVSTPLVDVCEAVIDNLHSTPVYDGDEFPCIRSQDVGWGTINYSTALRTGQSEFLHRVQRGEPQKGDIVYVREGDIGRCAVVDGSHRFCLGQRVMMFRPDAEVIEPTFLMYQLLSPAVLIDQVLSGRTGTTSHHINIKYLKQVRLRVPSLGEQAQIVSRLGASRTRISQLKELQSKTSGELNALLPSILDRAFKGEL